MWVSDVEASWVVLLSYTFSFFLEFSKLQCLAFLSSLFIFEFTVPTKVLWSPRFLWLPSSFRCWVCSFYQGPLIIEFVVIAKFTLVTKLPNLCQACDCFQAPFITEFPLVSEFFWISSDSNWFVSFIDHFFYVWF